MDWRVGIKRAIPPRLLNALLLRFPGLYVTQLVRQETSLVENRGVEDLVAQLERVLALEGDIVECGSSRCGSSVIMATRLRRGGVRKTLYACDSYRGFDPDELREERRRGLTKAPENAFTSTSLDYVRKKLRKLGMDDIVVPVPGYFRDTLPGLGTGFCFVFVDCDLQESMSFCAETLWPRLRSRGRMVFDDYACRDFAGARLAVDAFVAKHRDEIVEHGLLNRLYYVLKR
jgi:hypothetical protein